jgi:protein-L-isoaspartate(D-aspartate) O-methyltransferase
MPTTSIDFETLRKGMVDRQIAGRGVRDRRVLEAMRTVPREAFVPENIAEFAYDDTPLPIGEEQTISQPYIVALMAEALELRPEDKVLEIGAGSGYAAAVLSRIAREVYAIERHESLAREAQARLAMAPWGCPIQRHSMASWWRRADPRFPRRCSLSSRLAAGW